MAVKPRAVSAVVAVAIAIAAAFVPTMEGTRYLAYQDIGGVWTICQGHTGGVKKGDTATPAECDAYLRADLAQANNALDRCIRVELTSQQRAAFLSAIYNLGPAVVCGSTLQRKANAGDVLGACAELTDAKNSKGEPLGWIYAAGLPRRGLARRRALERAICEARS